VVALNLKKAPDLSKAAVWKRELWRHADDKPKRDEAITEISGIAIPIIGDHETVVLMHNDAVVQGLSEVPFNSDLEHWGVLTIGTGLGNARFTNRAAPAKADQKASGKSEKKNGAGKSASKKAEAKKAESKIVAK
jgi:hypothetical protein